MFKSKEKLRMSNDVENEVQEQEGGSQLNDTTAQTVNPANAAKKTAGAAVNRAKAQATRKMANWVRNKLGMESLKSAAKLSLSGPLGLLLLKVFIVLLIVILVIGIG